MNTIIDKIGNEGVIKERDKAFSVGDLVNIHFKILEAGKERIQQFAGTVVAKRGSGIRKMFTVRRISHGMGIERVFPLHSPLIDRIELESPGRVRRAKLYYLRKRSKKEARIKERDTSAEEKKAGGE